MDGVDVKFFGGAVTAYQPESGYRAGTDAILLAQSLSLKPGGKYLELGCGSGVVLLLAAHNCPEGNFTGLERSADMLKLSRQNTQDQNNINIVEGSIRSLPKDWHLQYDQVFCNPPFFDNRKAVRMSASKEPSFVNKKSLGIDDWIGAMLLMLKPRGIGTLIYRADGLEKVVAALGGKAGRLRVLPIHSYADAPAKRIIVQFRKGVKSESALLPPLIMHERDTPEKYTPIVKDILSGKKTLSLP